MAGTPKKVSLQERSYMMGNIVGVNGYHLNYNGLLQSLAEHGYRIHTTPHFILWMKPEDPKKFVLHWFVPEELDASIGHLCMEELQPFGILTQPAEFDDLCLAILFSAFERDTQRAGYIFSTNTLTKYHVLVESPTAHPTSRTSMDIFAHLYRRVLALHVGESLLDAGCSLGMLPLLIAEKLSTLTSIVGLDIERGSFQTAIALAQERNLHNVRFMEADLLSDSWLSLGPFDTVTLLHVLEHFSEDAMYFALTHLLAVTAQRLIIAVPYETGEPEKVYGHRQLFSRAKLEHVGAWCLQHIGGGHMHYEDCEDGLVVIDRNR